MRGSDKIKTDSGVALKKSGKTNKSIGYDENNDIIYSMPAKPLDFSFKTLKFLEELRTMEPRSGIRKPLENLKEQQAKTEAINKKDNNLSTLGLEDDDKTTKNKKQDTDDVVVGKIYGDKSGDNKTGKLTKKEDDKFEAPKKKVKYLTYTNSLVLHSNTIKSLKNIHSVLEDVLIDPKFLTNRSKVDLIQWIDISHNCIEDIHEDIIKLPFLKIFYCHANHISKIENVQILKKCKLLMSLTLHGNPIEHIKGYRHFVIEIVPSLEKLDFTLVSEKELDIIHFKGSRYGEKRKNGDIKEYPQLDSEIIKRMIVSKEETTYKKDDN